MTNEQPEAEDQYTKPWNQMSLWEKCWVVMCALDETADLRLERRVQLLEREIQGLKRSTGQQS